MKRDGAKTTCQKLNAGCWAKFIDVVLPTREGDQPQLVDHGQGDERVAMTEGKGSVSAKDIDEAFRVLRKATGGV